MSKKTPLYEQHLKAGAKMVDFAGWSMPINYGSQLQEHQVVREHAGVFDVSHMCAVNVRGEDSYNFLRAVLANDVAKLKDPWQALYSCMLNESGGIIDDLICYRISPSDYRLIVNAATADKDFKWLESESKNFGSLVVKEHDYAMLAVQGPQAVKIVDEICPTEAKTAILDLKRFHALQEEDLFIARTGYTGEDGVEIMLPAAKAADLWQKLLDKGVKPCGLGARDTLRLEAGYNLYGTDMDESTNPYESNLSWTIAISEDRNFIGKDALLQKKPQVDKKLTGLVLKDKGILRGGQKVITNEGEGIITSGSFAPSLGYSVALARIPKAATTAQVEIRNKLFDVEITKPPFIEK